MFLWTVSMTIGVLSNFIYSEIAAMFPDKPGGIALYAHEGWRRYFTPIGPIATFGYWFAWSSVLALFGIVIGGLITAEWFPGEPAGGTGAEATGYFSTGPVEIGLPHLIAAGAIVLVWLVNIFGIRPAVWLGYITGAMLMIPLAVFIFLPYVTGSWDSDNLTWTLNDEGQPWGGWKTALVWLFVMGWSAYGVETCATFAPEYKDTARDTSLALRTSALFTPVRLRVPSTRDQRCPDAAGDRGQPGRVLRAGLRRDPRRRLAGDGHSSDSQSAPVHEHGDRRRLTSALRHRARRHDDQATVPPQPVPCSRTSDDAWT